MTLSNAIREKIIKICDERSISIRKLTVLSDIPYSTMNSFLNKKCNSITMTTVSHICEGIGISVKEFFQDPLFDDVEIERKKRK